MSCAHCGTDSAERIWDMRPCAIGEHITYNLCDPCDLELNRIILEFFKVPNGDELLAEYAE
jgi:hypothetical protein